jgi:rSAM/selenodomain-associated transferase 1
VSAGLPGTAAAELVVFAKAPLLGRVKSRLAAGIGEEAALAFYRTTLEAVLPRLDGGGPWRTSLAVTPDEAVGDEDLWPTATPPRVPQGSGDVGDRMGRFLARAAPGRPVVIVGSDIPDLAAAHVERAFRALERHDLVLGPAADGGYWLIGASTPPPPTIFDGVRWSTERARADTLRNAARLAVTLVDELEDVDDLAAYRRFLARGPAGQP